MHKRLLLMTYLYFNIPILLGFPYAKQNGEICDWRSPAETCDQTRGLSCSYSSSTCQCWDQRRLYSTKTHRCVGKAGEECVYFESERLCTENAYCLEDRTLSPIPLCVCLKGYFRSDNGTCMKFSKHGEYCQPFPHKQACETESGLKCMNFQCQCEVGQFYDHEKDMCIAKAGQRCSRSLNNCINNAECNEKMWAYDYESGDTKVIGYRCGCKEGLKITEDGLCAADHGGICNKTSDCYVGENLSCLNGICQCHPLSQIYDKRARSCFNLVGTRCHLPVGEKREETNQLQGGSLASSFNNSNPNMDKTVEGGGGFPASAVGVSMSSCGTEGADCIPNAECVSTAQGNFCKCTNGSSETLMKTCLLDYGQPCQAVMQRITRARSQEQEQGMKKEMKCNVFEGLICHSDMGKCLCADPSLVHDENANGCVAAIGNLCGNVKLDLVDLDEDFKHRIYINCDTNSTCLEKNINGQNRRVCVPKTQGRLAGNGLGLVPGSLFNIANVIADTD